LLQVAIFPGNQFLLKEQKLSLRGNLFAFCGKDITKLMENFVSKMSLFQFPTEDNTTVLKPYQFHLFSSLSQVFTFFCLGKKIYWV
jgi:hypothetical protein